jgi:hypothetical protein
MMWPMPGVLDGQMVFGLNQAACVMLGRYVTKPNVMRQFAEERNSVSNEHRHTSDNEALNEACSQELLDRDPTVDIKVVSTAGSKI